MNKDQWSVVHSFLSYSDQHSLRLTSKGMPEVNPMEVIMQSPVDYIQELMDLERYWKHQCLKKYDEKYPQFRYDSGGIRSFDSVKYVNYGPITQVDVWIHSCSRIVNLYSYYPMVLNDVTEGLFTED